MRSLLLWCDNEHECLCTIVLGVGVGVGESLFLPNSEKAKGGRCWLLAAATICCIRGERNALADISHSIVPGYVLINGHLMMFKCIYCVMCTAYVLPIIQYWNFRFVCLKKHKHPDGGMHAWQAGASWQEWVKRRGGGGNTCPAKKEIGNQRNNNRLKKRTDSLTHSSRSWKLTTNCGSFTLFFNVESNTRIHRKHTRHLLGGRIRRLWNSWPVTN